MAVTSSGSIIEPAKKCKTRKQTRRAKMIEEITAQEHDISAFLDGDKFVDNTAFNRLENDTQL